NFISSKRTFTASVGWLAPLGIEEVTVEAWGGGGGGSSGNPSFSSSGGGGGGGGAYAKGTVSVTPGGIYAITVGAGGGPSTAGGDSSFVGDNGESVLAKGGSGSPVNTYSR